MKTELTKININYESKQTVVSHRLSRTLLYTNILVWKMQTLLIISQDYKFDITNLKYYIIHNQKFANLLKPVTNNKAQIRKHS